MRLFIVIRILCRVSGAVKSCVLGDVPILFQHSPWLAFTPFYHGRFVVVAKVETVFTSWKGVCGVDGLALAFNTDSLVLIRIFVSANIIEPISLLSVDPQVVQKFLCEQRGIREVVDKVIKAILLSNTRNASTLWDRDRLLFSVVLGNFPSSSTCRLSSMLGSRSTTSISAWSSR